MIYRIYTFQCEILIFTINQTSIFLTCYLLDVVLHIVIYEYREIVVLGYRMLLKVTVKNFEFVCFELFGYCKACKYQEQD